MNNLLAFLSILLVEWPLTTSGKIKNNFYGNSQSYGEEALFIKRCLCSGWKHTYSYGSRFQCKDDTSTAWHQYNRRVPWQLQQRNKYTVSHEAKYNKGVVNVALYRETN